MGRDGTRTAEPCEANEVSGVILAGDAAYPGQWWRVASQRKALNFGPSGASISGESGIRLLKSRL